MHATALNAREGQLRTAVGLFSSSHLPLEYAACSWPQLCRAPHLPKCCPACSMPQRLFKNDRIPHGWMAVSRYEEIEKVRAAVVCCGCS